MQLRVWYQSRLFVETLYELFTWLDGDLTDKLWSVVDKLERKLIDEPIASYFSQLDQAI